MTQEQFYRIVNNFYISKGIAVDLSRIDIDAELFNYVNANQKVEEYKVAFVFICLNPLYWQYASEMVEGAKKYFLPGHKTDFFFWTDIPETKKEIREEYKKGLTKLGMNAEDPVIWAGDVQLEGTSIIINFTQILDKIYKLRDVEGINIIPTEPVDWPYPTLLRYNLFLQEEEKLKDYDYIFYCDVDMKFQNIVGDEILGKEGLTAAQHPMYALKKEYWPPYEPSKDSASYIERPGRVIDDNGKPRFMPLYFAGGFQGGKSDKFIEAMKETKKIIEKDLAVQYIPIWNDESAWNKYLSQNAPEVVLTPSYIYPDSLIKEIYEPLWGCSYVPKLVTLTKWFSLSKEGGQAVQNMIKQNQK